MTWSATERRRSTLPAGGPLPIAVRTLPVRHRNVLSGTGVQVSSLDHLIKDRLRLRGYLRYMDDLALFHDDRASLARIARTVEEAAWALRLRLHPYEIKPTKGGMTFV